METIFSTLMSKTLFIIASQIFVTFLSTQYLINYFKKLYSQKNPNVTAIQKPDGELDLIVFWPYIKKWVYASLTASVLLFFIVMYFSSRNPGLAYFTFVIWSLVTGVTLGFSLLSIDENLGARALQLTSLVTFGATFIGVYSKIDFSFLGEILFFVLLALILYRLVSLFKAFSNKMHLIVSFISAIAFTFYLIYDFNKLSQMNNIQIENTWSTAIDFAVEIYLDIINLFLDILDILHRLSKT